MNSATETARRFLSDVIGHDDVAERLRLLVERDRVPNGILFVGEEGRGKRTVAHAFARELLARAAPAGARPRAERDARAGTHPGLVHVEPLREERFLPVRRVRRLLESCSLSVAFGDLRVVILARLHLLNEESGNALLKFLEEPPPKTLILATARDPGSVLETIRSRLQLVSVGPLTEAEVARVLERAAFPPADAPLLAYLSRGAPGNAWRFHRGDLEASLLDPLKRLFSGESPFAWAEDLVKRAKEEGGAYAESRNDVGPEAAVRALRELRSAQEQELEDERRSESGLEAARNWLRPIVEAAGCVIQEAARVAAGVPRDRTTLVSRVLSDDPAILRRTVSALRGSMSDVVECLENLDRNLTLNLVLEQLAMRLGEP